MVTLPLQRRELAWSLRFSLVTGLAGFFALAAHLVAGGAIQSLVGLVVAVVFTALISMVVLVRANFARVLVAMLAGQYVFHTFMGVGATGGHHHGAEAFVEPVVVGSGWDGMVAFHFLAACLSATLVAGADHALRVLALVGRALARLLERAVNSPAPVEIAGTQLSALPIGSGKRAHIEGLVGSRGLRGPPAFM